MKPETKQIVIFGINYAPELTGIAPYTTELAEHFATGGHLVRVVTGIPHYPVWRRLPIPPGDRRRNPHVARYQHFVPGRPNALGRMLYELTWLLSAARGLTPPAVDAVIGIVPSLSGGLLAVLGGLRWHAPVGIVVKDLMGPAALQSGYRGGGVVAGATVKLEGAVLRRAERVGIISDGFRSYIRAAGVSESKIQRLVDWSHPGAPSESRDSSRARLGWSSSEFVCLHAGNMGQKQGLDTLLDAAPILQDKGVRLVLAGDGNDRGRLVDRVSREQIGNVSFIGLQEPGQYEAMLRAADLLVVNQRPSVAEMSLPSKLASYFAAGRPVLAAVAAECETAVKVRESKAGRVVAPGDAAAMAEAITLLKESPEICAAMAIRGPSYAEAHLSRSTGLAAYDQFLEYLCSGRDSSKFATRVQGDR